MDAARLSRLIAVRHKEPGHLRLELPPELGGPAARAHLATGLRARAGVYRIEFESASRLSIRFDAHLCGLQDVARCLRALLDGLPAEGATASADATGQPPDTDPLTAARRIVERGARQVNERVQGLLDKLREPGAPTGSLQARLQPILKGALTERATVNFLNDVLMFYLIRVHWDLITKQWMKNPLRHADAWLTTFYLVFLLVRYRKSLK
jgi:hypothetical protein